MRCHVVVRGRVQGVGFRWFVREEARRLNVAGWVRNRADGCVEVAAEGTNDSIDALRRALEEGPPGATVASVDDVEEAPALLVRPFTILK
jgi:acylphosphatase